jgi:hypothetical protein
MNCGQSFIFDSDSEKIAEFTRLAVKGQYDASEV